MAQMLFITS